MEENRLKKLHHTGKPYISIGGVILNNQFIGVMQTNGRLITTEGLIPLFLGYSEGEKSLLAFLRGEFWYTMPMSRIIPFPHDPQTGMEIEWDRIRVAVENELKNPTRDWRS